MLILETPRLILRPFQDSDLEPFVAYRSDPEVARYQGWEAPYSVESAMEFIYAFRDLGLHRVVASCDVDNLASARLLERVGMRREGHFIENIWFKGAWGSVNGPVCPAKSSAPDNGLNPPPAGSPPAGDFFRLTFTVRSIQSQSGSRSGGSQMMCESYKEASNDGV